MSVAPCWGPESQTCRRAGAKEAAGTLITGAGRTQTSLRDRFPLSSFISLPLLKTTSHDRITPLLLLFILISQEGFYMCVYIYIYSACLEFLRESEALTRTRCVNFTRRVWRSNCKALCSSTLTGLTKRAEVMGTLRSEQYLLTCRIQGGCQKESCPIQVFAYTRPLCGF